MTTEFTIVVGKRTLAVLITMLLLPPHVGCNKHRKPVIRLIHVFALGIIRTLHSPLELFIRSPSSELLFVRENWLGCYAPPLTSGRLATSTVPLFFVSRKCLHSVLYKHHTVHYSLTTELTTVVGMRNLAALILCFSSHFMYRSSSFYPRVCIGYCTYTTQFITV